jgi:hypothetical protein
LIKVGWITFEKALNMNTNPLPNYVTGSKTANALEIEGPMSLKMSLNKIYEMLVKTEYKEGS